MSPLAAALHTLVCRRIKARQGVLRLYQYLYAPQLTSFEEVTRLCDLGPEDKHLLLELAALPIPQLDEIIKNDLELYRAGHGLNRADHEYFENTLRHTAEVLIAPPV